MRYLKWIAPLTFFYMALTANGEPLNWLLGILLAAGITALIRPNPSPIQWRALGTTLLAAGQFLLRLLWDLLVSSVGVAWLVLQKEMPLRQGIIALPSDSDSKLVTLLSAQAITLTPGELVVEIDEDGVMYTHSLDVVVAAEREPAAQKRRVQLLERIV